MVKQPRVIFLIHLFVLIIFSSCGDAPRWRTASFFYFDTLIEARLFCRESELQQAEKDIEAIFAELTILFSPGAENLSSPVVLGLFSRAEKIYQDTSGCFDISIEPLSQLWGFREKEHRVPTKAEIKSVLSLVGMNKVRKEASQLVLQPGMKLDWGGIAKGYGVDLAAQKLMKEGFDRGFINAGGDLYCWGKNPDSTLWRIGVQHPRQKGLIGILSISETAAATTGDYIRYFEQSGFRYHHVFDPATGYPARGKQSVTVLGKETLVCDALATALFVCQKPEEVLSYYPNYGAVIILDSGKVIKAGKEFPFSLMKK